MRLRRSREASPNMTYIKLNADFTVERMAAEPNLMQVRLRGERTGMYLEFVPQSGPFWNRKGAHWRILVSDGAGDELVLGEGFASVVDALFVLRRVLHCCKVTK
jgi:hypothetical protein